MTDAVRVYRPIHAAIEIGDAIEVSPTRERGVETDPVMTRLRDEIESMLARLKEKRPKGIIADSTRRPMLGNLRIE